MVECLLLKDCAILFIWTTLNALGNWRNTCEQRYPVCRPPRMPSMDRNLGCQSSSTFKRDQGLGLTGKRTVSLKPSGPFPVVPGLGIHVHDPTGGLGLAQEGCAPHEAPFPGDRPHQTGLWEPPGPLGRTQGWMRRWQWGLLWEAASCQPRQRSLSV